ncbi:MAG: DNA cytosine methyltransferase [Nitrososphaeria archaeon]
MKKYALFSLFSGAGGLDLGFKLTGSFSILFGNDVSAPATYSFARNFGAKILTREPTSSDLPAVFLGDVTKLKFNGFDAVRPDVVSGGPPCQDFSIVRGPPAERSGIRVSRGKLYSHFIRALYYLQPPVFVFENVPGLMSANRGEAYKVIREDFSNLNIRWSEIKALLGNSSSAPPKAYEVLFSGLVDASKLGVPQARKRLIIIGVRKDLLNSLLQGVTVVKEKIEATLTGRGTLVSKYPLVPLEVFEGQALPDLQSKYVEIMKEYEGIAEEVKTLRALEWERGIAKLTYDAIEDYLALNGIKPLSKSEIDEAFEEHAKILKELGYYGVKVSEVKSRDGSNRLPKGSKAVLERMRRIPPGENHEFVRGTKWEVEGRGISLIYRRIHPLKPAYTVVAYGGGGTWGYHYERGRAMLTNRERARLQTFPDDFLFEGSWSEVRAQIGEAVPPLMAKRIGEVVAGILENFS